VFFWHYLIDELRRRRGRTALTALGLAIGVALVAAVSALSAGLDRAQDGVLDPLSSVGTDLVVTRTAAEESATAGPGDGPGGGATQAASVAEETQSVVTDLSELGEPGDEFVHDFFLPSTQLSFDEEEASAIESVEGVSATAVGLTVQVSHQEGTVPEIVAELETGGETIEQEIVIEPPTDEEAAAIQACVEAQGGGTGGEGGDPGGPPGFGGRVIGGGRAFQECLPERFQRQIARFTTPQRTIQQVIDPPETDITTESYTAAGIDASQPGLGLLTDAQIVDGRFLSRDGGSAKEVVLATGYAEQEALAVGDTITINGEQFEVVGLAKPPLGGQSADVYFHLDELQRLSDRAGRVNTVLVRADDAAAVAEIGDEIGATFDGAQITSAEDLAGQVSGSLVDAGKLVDSVGVAFVLVVLITVVALASLVTLSSVAKRTRELGTLKAIGWSERLVVRQVLGESLAQGLLGGVVGVALGIAAAAAMSAFGPDLSAAAPASAGPSAGLFGLGTVESTAESASVSLQAPLDAGVIVMAVALALAGGLVAGALGSWRAARLRPADALREV
jgi:ABC-type antimicrobial peptide transport system permease subunit